MLQELTPAWVAALAPLGSQYPHRHLHPREDPYGIGVLSRLALERVDALDLAGDGLPSLVAVVDARGRRVQVIGLHTAWPVLRPLQDLNLTPYAPAFARLLRESGLRDALATRAWRPTWQAGLWPLALPIDHVLVPADACVLDARVGPELGSDHRPVTVRLNWR